MTDQIHEDIEQEAPRLVAAGQAKGLVLRLLGGLAVRLHAPSAALPALARRYQDIDVVTTVRHGPDVEVLLNMLGYTPDKAFNLLNGNSRLLFHDQVHGRQIDVFVGQFEMCHRLPIAERLDRDSPTLALAELLLTKLQIVQLNDKDIRDICALLVDHSLGAGDQEMINAPRIAQLCGEDWGLWKTVMLNLDKAREIGAGYDLEPSARQTLVGRLDDLRDTLEHAPKSLRWKMRAAIGERVRWYELPEDARPT
jgi:hypothetical protein